MSQRSLQLDPLKAPATWEQIKAKRNELRLAPITLSSGLTYDFDKDSMELMPRSIKRFYSLPTLDENGALPWKMADNTYIAHSLIMLTAALDELEEKQAVRAASLQVAAEVLYQSGATVGTVNDLSAWGIA